MATWDGSSQEAQNPNYYYYYPQDNVDPNPSQNWQYYSQNTPNSFYQDGPSAGALNNTTHHRNDHANAFPDASQYSPANQPRGQYQPQYSTYYFNNRNPETNTKSNKYHRGQNSRNFQTTNQPKSKDAAGTYENVSGEHETRQKENRTFNNKSNVNGKPEYSQFPQQKKNANANVNKRMQNQGGGSGRFYNRYQRNTYFRNGSQNSRGELGLADLAGSSTEEGSRRNYNKHKEDNRNFRDAEDQRSVSSENSNSQGRKRQNYSEDVSMGASKTEKYYDKFKDRRSRYPNKDKQYYSTDTDHKFDRTKEKKDVPKESREKDSMNWRQKTPSDNKASVAKRKYTKKHDNDDDASQRERLTDQLNRGQLECLVCCDSIRQNDSIWSCSNCYHVLHLKCVKKWAKASQDDNGWRCPACQNITVSVPEDYFCFCGKLRSPEWNRRDIAHSCGEMCERTRVLNGCVHKCTLLCHPGSCPPCLAMITRICGCGKMSRSLKCSASTFLLCEDICEKLLNCEEHKCAKKCHHGDCGVCEEKIEQVCFCGKNSREVPCETDTPLTYECKDTCDKTLNCENHQCAELCHPGPCKGCALMPDVVTHCCCQQTPLTEKRSSCLEPVPTCDKICSKPLKCGQPSDPHRCKQNCHVGDCPSCDSTTMVRCRCGNMDKEIPCSELVTKADDARCEKRCTKKRNCGKPKCRCNLFCCIEIDHPCNSVCQKLLSCGKHTCEQNHHQGRCQPCWRSSFDELYCECGAAVIYPPVACGTKRPVCEKPCSRQHSCGHEVLHNCHSDQTCPPCTVLTQRWCYGKHEVRNAVPCHVKEISCGLPCNKPLSCGRHKCITRCHPGSCNKPGQVCTQPCTVPRELCGHICGASCHEDKCPDMPCKEMVKVTCPCGHRSMSRVCAENVREYQRIATGILASKMADLQLGHSVINLDEVFGQNAKKQNQLKTLECNDECKLVERNRRLALGLQIANPDLSGKLMPRYSDFMKQWAKKDSKFCQMVHDKLAELVQMAKTSKSKSRSYSFECMNREKRAFLHESCEHFGCDSQAYDQEPNRNIVATAVKDKCWLPSYSLLEMVQRENGQRKVPGPMLKSTMSSGVIRNANILPLNSRKSQKPSTSSADSPAKSPEPEIDYFDCQW